MPYPAQISADAVLDEARALLEAEGYEALSLHRLAAALNVKAPSLYRYFDGKAALLRAVNEQLTRELVDAMRAAADTAGDGEARLPAMFRAYRAFALAHPIGYALAFSSTIPEQRLDPAIGEALALPLQAVMAELSGEARSLDALRGAWAMVHGFVTLELSGQFQRGGSIDAAFEASIAAYVCGWQRS